MTLADRFTGRLREFDLDLQEIRMAEINDADPVFLSYRHSDGDALAERAAWVLRAHGVTVWHDQTHLPPGQFRRRLRETLQTGLSGAVLLVTPDTARSSIVREMELSALLEMEKDPAFTFAIGSTIVGPDGKLDYTAPDRLLPQPVARLSDFEQFNVLEHAGLASLAGEMAARRVRRAASDGRLHLDVQTRLDPLGTENVPLAVRTRPPYPGTSVPPPEAWEDFAPFLGQLPRIVQAAGARHLHITGGAHLSMAFALGAALPVTTGIAVTVVDQLGADWTTGDAESVSLVQEDVPLEGAASDPVAVYLDLVTAAPNNGFRRYVETHSFAHAVEISVAKREPIPAESGPALVAEIHQLIGRILAGRPLHLFMRVPFPIALLLGRACNTLRVTLYEWEREDEPPGYVEMATVSAGRSGGPLVSWKTDPLPSMAS